jgi:hypothetical protein
MTDASTALSDMMANMKSELGWFTTFPYDKLPYFQNEIQELARYGFVWKDDGSELGYIECVYCKLTIKGWIVDWVENMASKHADMYSDELLS